MTKVVTLTIGERLAALKMLDVFKGSITQLAAILEDVKKVAITPEEWEGAKRQIIKGTQADGQPTESWKWNEDDASTHKEVTLLNETHDYLARSIKEKSDKGEITIADVALISLDGKLK